MSKTPEEYQKLLSEADKMLYEIDQKRLLWADDPVEKDKLAYQANAIKTEIERLTGKPANPAPTGDSLSDARAALLLGKQQVQHIINNNYNTNYNVGGSGNVVNTGSGTVNNSPVNTGGGAYIGSGTTISNSGGITQLGGTMGDVNYTDNRGKAGDEAKLQAMFAELLQHIEAAPASEDEKTEAKEAVDTLKEEVEKAKKDPQHKPKGITMKSMIAAFKNLGAPVASAAMNIMGLPMVGTAINQFAEKLPDNK